MTTLQLKPSAQEQGDQERRQREQLREEAEIVLGTNDVRAIELYVRKALKGSLALTDKEQEYLFESFDHREVQE